MGLFLILFLILLLYFFGHYRLLNLFLSNIIFRNIILSLLWFYFTITLFNLLLLIILNTLLHRLLFFNNNSSANSFSLHPTDHELSHITWSFQNNIIQHRSKENVNIICDIFINLCFSLLYLFNRSHYKIL